MSSQIDDRIVSMQFDNRNFEENVNTSLSTLDKLKQSLTFNGDLSGFDKIGSAIKGVTFDPMLGALETVGGRFNAMSVIAITALQNITNSVINTGKRMLNDLTLAPINDGVKEYEEKINSVQTILMSAKNKDGTAVSLDQVKQKLEELNTYSDKTIYSFKDMTSNIGKFTNAGVDLDTAVKAIQGVSNEAAISGANANEASRAMYNFAQALSAGYVKLIDWKSIENANMATVDFKNELLETAVAAGTLKKNSDGMYTVLSKNASGSTMKEAISATSNFNDSLAYQWMTTEVLTQTLAKYADETTDIGKKAYAAAQDVKTFTQLMDTLKEAVGSGWAQTFELIIGDYNEAKKLWTAVSNAVGGLIQKQSDQRNNALKAWNALGGRTKALEALKNIIGEISKVTGVFGEAFREVFGDRLKGAGGRLYELTKRFKAFTDRMKLSEEDLAKVKTAFKGFFSIFDIGKQAISAIVNAFKPLLGLIPHVELDFLGAAASAGKWITNLSEFIRENDIFGKAIQSVIDHVKSLVEWVQQLITKFEDLFHRLSGMTVGEAFDKAKQKVTDFVESLKGIFKKNDALNEDIDSPMAKLKEFGKAKTLLDPLKSFGEGLAAVFGGLWHVITGFAPIIGKGLNLVGTALKSFGERIKETFQNGGMNGLIDFAQGGILAVIGVQIAGFFSKLKGLGNNLSGLTEGLGEVFDKIKGFLGDKGDAFNIDSIRNIAISIAILAGSLILLSMVDAVKLGIALGALQAIFMELEHALVELSNIDMSKFKGFGKVSLALIGLSVAILILSAAMKRIASLDIAGITKGLVAVNILISSLTKATKEMSQNTGNMKRVFGVLIGLSVAVLLLTTAVKKLGALPVEQLGKGLLSVMGLIVGLTFFMKYVDSSGFGISSGLGLIALAGAINLLYLAVKNFAKLNVEELQQGLVAVGAIIAGLAVFTKYTSGSKGMISVGIGMIFLSTALLIVQKAVEKFGKMDINQMFIGLGGLAAALLALALFANAMKGTIGGASALLIMSVALYAVVGAIGLLGKMKISTLVKGIAALGTALFAMAFAGSIASVAVPGILALGAAFVMVGAGVTLFGAGLLLVVTAIDLLIAGAAGFAAAFGAVLTGVIMFIPTIAAAIAKLLASIVKSIVGVFPTILGSVTELVKMVVKTIVDLLPEFITILHTLVDALMTEVPYLFNAGLQILIGLLSGIRDNIGEITKLVSEIIQEFLTSFSNEVPHLMESVATLILKVLEGIQYVLLEYGDVIIDSIIGILKTIVTVIVSYIPKFLDMAIDLVIGLAQGVIQSGWRFIQEVSSLIDKVISTVANTLIKFNQKGQEIVSKIITGIKQKTWELIQAAAELISKVLNAIREKVGEFLQIGKDIVNGIKNGINNAASSAISAAKDLARNVTNGAKNVLGIQSPSKVFAEIGKFVDEGFAKGLTDYAGRVIAASENVGDSIVGSVEDSVKRVNTLSDSLSFNPYVRPVVDNTQLDRTMNALSGLGNSDKIVDLTGSVGFDDKLMHMLSNILTAINQNGDVYLDEDILVGRIDRRLGTL